MLSYNGWIGRLCSYSATSDTKEDMEAKLHALWTEPSGQKIITYLIFKTFLECPPTQNCGPHKLVI